MAKLVTVDITGGYGSAATHNSNLDAIETAMEKTLSRDGTSPNQMLAQLDMNSYRIINLADGVAASDAVRKDYVDDAINAVIAAGLPVQTGHAGQALVTDGTNADWAAVEAAGAAAAAVAAHVAAVDPHPTYTTAAELSSALAAYQPLDSDLTTIAANITAAGHALLDDATAGDQRTTLGLGSLATLSTINDGNWSGTDLAVANGGTGASDAGTARTNLGVTATGSDSTYAYRSNNLSDLGNAATARTNLGLGSVENTALSTWAGSSNITTIGTLSSGTVPVARVSGLGSLATLSTVNDGNWSGTDLAITNGGTGASTAQAARQNLELDDDCIEFVIDGVGSTITTGVKGDIEIPYTCTIASWTLLADQSGSIVIDVWQDTYANFPPTNVDAMPGAGKEPTITTATKAQDLDVSDWTSVTLTQGNILRFNVDSCTSIQRVTLVLRVTR